MAREIKKVHYTNFHIAGFAYWDGCQAFEHLKMGTELTLEREVNNYHDPYAVAIYYKDFKLGYVPSRENHDICKFVEMGWGDIFEARIQKISPDAHPENQVHVILYIRQKTSKK